MTSAFSTPIQAKVFCAGLVKLRKIVCRGFNRKDLPQLAGPVMRILRCLPRPEVIKVTTARENSPSPNPLRDSVSLASCIQRPLQPSTHSASRDSLRICMRVFDDLSRSSLAHCISQVVAISLTQRSMLFSTYRGRSRFPSSRCTCTRLNRSSLVRMFLAMIVSARSSESNRRRFVEADAERLVLVL